MSSYSNGREMIFEVRSLLICPCDAATWRSHTAQSISYARPGSEMTYLSTTMEGPMRAAYGFATSISRARMRYVLGQRCRGLSCAADDTNTANSARKTTIGAPCARRSPPARLNVFGVACLHFGHGWCTRFREAVIMKLNDPQHQTAILDLSAIVQSTISLSDEHVSTRVTANHRCIAVVSCQMRLAHLVHRFGV